MVGPRIPVASSVKTKSLPLLLAALLLVARPALSQSDVRQELLGLINAERARAGSPPLHLEGSLNQAAQQHAEELSRLGSLRGGSAGDMSRRIEQAGYQAHEWTENLINTRSGLDDVVHSWKARNPSSFRSLMDPDYRDLGIGVSRLDGMPLYSFLFAVPQGDYFTRETSDLRDRRQVQEEMLARINAARKKAGLQPLLENPLLDKAAQRHAEDMLARGYFAHRSPAGTTVRERSKAAGYDWRTIGENLAYGQTSVEEVVQTWLESPGHRRNILNPDFRELGVGLAMGRGADGKYQVLWVQNFGAPRG
jgi:uncharacterized protein YkwD